MLENLGIPQPIYAINQDVQQGRSLGYHTPEQVSNPEPPESGFSTLRISHYWTRGGVGKRVPMAAAHLDVTAS